MSTSVRHITAGLIVALMMLSACSLPGGNAEQPKLRILRVGITSVTGTPAGQLGWGHSQGILLEQLRPAGVERIDFSFFQSGRDVVAALLAGAVDVAAVGDNPSLTAKGNGADLVLLALDGINGDTWLIGAKGGPTTIEDLVGGTVTAPQGTIRDRAARQLIDKAGLADRIEVRDVPTPESIAGLASGTIDATLVGGTGAADLERQGFPVIAKTSDHPGLASVGTTVAVRQLSEQNPAVVQAWREAIVATNLDITKRLGEYQQWVAQTDGVDVELVRQSVNADQFNTEAFPAEGLTQLTNAYEFLLAEKIIDTPFDVQEWVGA